MAPVMLIVEDETAIRIVAEAALRQAGYETLSAGAVDEALAIIEKRDVRIDLLFTDLGLRGHGLGGLTVGMLCAKFRPGTPVLYTTGERITDLIRALFVDPYSFLAKPYTLDQMTIAVAKLIV